MCVLSVLGLAYVLPHTRHRFARLSPLKLSFEELKLSGDDVVFPTTTVVVAVVVGVEVIVGDVATLV